MAPLNWSCVTVSLRFSFFIPIWLGIWNFDNRLLCSNVGVLKYRFAMIYSFFCSFFWFFLFSCNHCSKYFGITRTLVFNLEFYSWLIEEKTRQRTWNYKHTSFDRNRMGRKWMRIKSVWSKHWQHQKRIELF